MPVRTDDEGPVVIWVIDLPDPRRTVPAMVGVAMRHARLNLLNLEAVAMGQVLGATLWLSTETATGVLPGVLDQERVAWRTITIEIPTISYST